MAMITINDRIKEIEELVASNELDSATKRLMDFVTDFSTDRKYRRQSIVIRSAYNKLREDSRLFGSTRQILIRTREISNQILEIVESVVESDRTQSALASPELDVVETDNVHQPSSSQPLESVSDQKVLTSITVAESEHASESKSVKEDTEVVFEGIGITHTYVGKTISFTLHPIDLKLRLGEITAVVGENGNGKTTLLKIVAGLLASKGDLRYPALSQPSPSDAYTIQQQIAYIPQELPRWPGSLARSLHFTASAHGVRGDKNAQDVEYIVNRLSLDKYLSATWDQISGGFKTRFSIAKALLGHPKLLILDEPLADLDINTQAIVLQDLRHLTDSLTARMSVIVSSQHLHEVESIADNIIFLKGGKALYNGSVRCFGDDRTENSYELMCDLAKSQVMDALREIDFTRIEAEGAAFIIYTPRHITAARLLQALLTADINPRYFRDISKSTRRLFAEHST